jgi:hypothetical protein
VAALTDSLKDDTAGVRQGAARALGQIGPHAAKAAPALCAVLVQGKDAALVLLSVQALGRLKVKTKEVSESLTRIVWNEDEEMRCAALVALDQLGPEVIVLREAVKAQEDASARVAGLADKVVQRKVRSLGKGDVADLKFILTKKKTRLCVYALDALARIGSGAKEPARIAAATRNLKLGKEVRQALATLVNNLEVADLQDKAVTALREAAATALSRAGKLAIPSLVKALEGRFEGGKELTKKNILKKRARIVAIQVLGKMGPEGNTAQARKTLENLMDNDPVRAVQEEARKALLQIRGSD